MKRNYITILSSLSILVASCGNNAEVKEVTTDTLTIVKTDTVTLITPVDTASIVAFYIAEHAKNKGTHTPVAKAKGTKKVSVDSDPTFGATDMILAPSATSSETAQDKSATKVIHDLDMYYFIPNEKASFPGGEKSFDQYLIENLEYPQAALDANESRVVYPTVFLDEQGKTVKVEFPGPPTIYGFQDEARRILMASPKWNPAKFGGMPVKSKFTIPIRFKLM